MNVHDPLIARFIKPLAVVFGDVSSIGGSVIGAVIKPSRSSFLSTQVMMINLDDQDHRVEGTSNLRSQKKHCGIIEKLINPLIREL